MSATTLSFIIFLPAIVAFVLMITTKHAETVRNIAFFTTTVVFGLALKIYAEFVPSQTMQFVTNVQWIRKYGINYNIGIDGFSLTILMLIAILIPIAYLLMWRGRTKGYWVNMLLAQTAVTGALLSLDIVMFYFFWESMMLPIFLIIGTRGTGHKVFATIKVTVFTIAGSLLMLIAIIYIGVAYFDQFGHWSFAISDLIQITSISDTVRLWLFAAFTVAFAIKIPLFPFHTWIIDTYTTAPTGGVFVLSSVMSKLGVYAILRFMIPLFPGISMQYSKYFVFLGLLGLIYFGIISLKQNDIKKMFAYASASHLNLIVAGIFTLNLYGMNGSLYLVVAHAIATGGLFLLVGILHFETGFKTIRELGGIAKQAPVYTFIFAIFLFSNIGLPATSGFVSELMIIFGIYESSHIMGYLSATTMIMSASFMLWMFQRAILQDHDNKIEEHPAKMRELRPVEILAMLTWVVLIVYMGIFPETFMDKFEPTVIQYIDQITKAGALK